MFPAFGRGVEARHAVGVLRHHASGRPALVVVLLCIGGRCGVVEASVVRPCGRVLWVVSLVLDSWIVDASISPAHEWCVVVMFSYCSVNLCLCCFC
jgi:hypothetical protein